MKLLGELKLIKLRKVAILLLVLGALGGCSNQPLQPNRWYQLNRASSSSLDSQVVESVEPNWILAPVEMPAYLLQPSLLIQQQGNRLHHALHDQWAEPLDQGFSRLLVEQLQQRGINVYPSSQFEKDAHRLWIKINHFYPTDQSEVVLQGYYRLDDRKQQQNIIGKNFLFKIKLEQDGYAHAVNQMAELVIRLAAELALLKGVKLPIEYQEIDESKR